MSLDFIVNVSVCGCWYRHVAYLLEFFAYPTLRNVGLEFQSQFWTCCLLNFWSFCGMNTNFQVTIFSYFHITCTTRSSIWMLSLHSSLCDLWASEWPKLMTSSHFSFTHCSISIMFHTSGSELQQCYVFLCLRI